MAFQICIKPDPALIDKSVKPLAERWISIEQGQSLLSASERHAHQSIAVGCRGGGCGICKVRILSGDFDSKVMSKTHISDEQKEEGWVLACRVFPKSDMTVISSNHPDKRRTI